MAVKPGYKQTEVGFIPEAWEVESLNSIGRVIRGSSPRPKGDKRYYGGDVPRLMVEDVTRDRKYVTPTIDFLTVEGAKLSRPCKKGTLTVVCSGTPTVVGLPSILGVDACIHDGMLGLVRLSPTVEPEYLFYRLTDLQGQLQAAATHGGTFVNLTTKGFGAFRITVPPLPEQRTISTVLSDVDALLAALERLIAKKRDLKQAAMQKLLTGQTRLPGFSAEWTPTTLGEVATFLSGGTPSRGNDVYWNGNIPWISATSLRCFEVWRSDSNVTEEAVASGSKIAPIGTTLLLVRGSALHKEILCGLVTKRVCFNQDVKALVPHCKVFPRFLTTLIKGRAKDFLKLVSSAGNTAGVLDTKLLRAFEFLLPGLAEQTAIANVLADMDSELATLEQRLAKTRALKQGMVQELLTGRIRLL